MAWGDFLGTGWNASQVTLAASTAAVLAVTLYTLRRRSRPAVAAPVPDAWRRVGVLSDITCYPIKSCGGVRLQTSHCAVLGLENGFLRDRVFVVMRDGGKSLSGRIYPKLTQIIPSVEGSTMTLRTEGMPDISFDIAALPDKATGKSREWSQTVCTVDCGDAVATWLSRALLDGADVGLRLAYFPGETATRQLKALNEFKKNGASQHVGPFPDESSFCLMASASVADLNSRLERPVPARQFRANFIVETETAFAEDAWEWVRVGDVVFQKILPCTRENACLSCKFITVDPDTGLKSEDTEPLKTLKRYRQVTDPTLVRHAGTAPALGIYLEVVGTGDISVGDPVFAQ